MAPSTEKDRRSGSGAAEVTRSTSVQVLHVPVKASPKSSAISPCSSREAIGRGRVGAQSDQWIARESPGPTLRPSPQVPVEIVAEPDVEAVNQARADAVLSSNRRTVAPSSARPLRVSRRRRRPRDSRATRRSPEGRADAPSHGSASATLERRSPRDRESSVTAASRASSPAGVAASRPSAARASAMTDAGASPMVRRCLTTWLLSPSLVRNPAPQRAQA